MNNRDIDVIIAKKIFSHIVIIEKNVYKSIDLKNKTRGILPNYSSNLEHTYFLVNHLQYNGYSCKNGQYFDENGDSVYKCILENVHKNKRSEEIGDTLEKSICLAAIKLFE